MKRISLPNYISRNGSRFETTDAFLKETSVVNSTSDTLESAGIPLTHIDENSFATSSEEKHCFVIGDSGCGKTRRVILPTIRLLAKAGESMVISDPKGELYKTTANSLEKKGYSVHVLNFRNPKCGNRWNPLAIIDKFYHSGDSDSKDKALMLINDIVSVLIDGMEGKDPYWAMSAGSVFRGVCLYILEYGEPGDLTFENIALTAREINEYIEKEKNAGSYSSKPFEAFIASLPKGSPITQNLSVIITNASTTRSCIMSEFETMTSLYSSQESLMDLFAISEIDINSLGISPTAIFFILPDDTEALYPIATVFVKQIYSSLVSLADEQENGKLPNRVTFLLDEFANFAKMPSIESMLTAARSRNIRFVLVCQSMDQLTKKYEQSGTETLLANCRIWVYMSCRNLPFLRRLEELAGYYISPHTYEKIPLIDIGELQHFEMGKVLVLNDRCRPMLGFLPDYEEYDFGADGTDEEIKMPAPHSKISRRQFSLNKTLNDALRINEERNREREEKEKNQRAQEIASVLDGNSKEDDASDSSKGKKMTAEEVFIFIENTDDSIALSELLGEILTDFRAKIDALDTSTPGSQSGVDSRFEFIDEVIDYKTADAAAAIIDNIIAKIETKVGLASDDGKEDEAETPTYNEANNNPITLFRNGEYNKAVNVLINEAIDFPSTSTMNNLAFLIRFCKPDIEQFNAPFSLSIPDLLQKGIERNEAFSLVNAALYEIENKNFEKATELFLRLSSADWEDVANFWLYDVYYRFDGHPEGALIALLADYHTDKNLLLSDDNPPSMLLEIAKEAYGEYIASPWFELIYSDEDPPFEGVSDEDFHKILDKLLENAKADNNKNGGDDGDDDDDDE